MNRQQRRRSRGKVPIRRPISLRRDTQDHWKDVMHVVCGHCGRLVPYSWLKDRPGGGIWCRLCEEGTDVTRDMAGDVPDVQETGPEDGPD